MTSQLICILFLWNLSRDCLELTFLDWLYLSGRVFLKGWQCTRGHQKSVCIWFSQKRHLTSANQLSLNLHLSSTSRQEWQSFLEEMIVSSNSALPISQMIEQSNDFMSQFSACPTRSRQMIRDQDYSLLLILSIVMFLSRLGYLERVTNPTSPDCRIIRLGWLSCPLIIWSGWQKCASIFSDSFSMAWLPKGIRSRKWLNSFQLASCRKEDLSDSGSSLSNLFSSAQSDFCLILDSSMMQREISSQMVLETLDFLASELSSFSLLFLSLSSCLMLLIRFPMQLILYPKKTQAKKEMTMMKKASAVLVACRSPKPMVRMIVVPKQQLQIYCSYHCSWSMLLGVIQLLSPCMKAIAISVQASRWHTKRFFTITLNRLQYFCSWDALMNLSSRRCSCSTKWEIVKQGPANSMQLIFASKQLNATAATVEISAQNSSTILTFFSLRKRKYFYWFAPLLSAEQLFCRVSVKSQKLKTTAAHLSAKSAVVASTFGQRRERGKRKKQRTVKATLAIQMKWRIFLLNVSCSFQKNQMFSSENMFQKGLQETGFLRRLLSVALWQNIFIISLFFIILWNSGFSELLPLSISCSSLEDSLELFFPLPPFAWLDSGPALSSRKLSDLARELLFFCESPSCALKLISIPESISSLLQQKSLSFQICPLDLHGRGPVLRRPHRFSIISLQKLSYSSKETAEMET